MDRRLHASPEQIAADNQIALAGRAEIETGRMSETSRHRERFNHLGSAGQPGHGVAGPNAGQHPGPLTGHPTGQSTGQPSGAKGILKSIRDPRGNLRVVNE